jgi:hypothetical protein
MSGLLPCPDARGPKIKKVKVSNKRPVEYTASISAYRAGEQSSENKERVKSTDSRYVQNVTLEEWDCPKPGEKKYKPKAVRDNIRKNMKRIKSDQKETAASDSTRSR